MKLFGKMQVDSFPAFFKSDDLQMKEVSEEPKRSLAKSVTEDDTESSEATPTSFSDAEYFLERYDEMMRIQKDEMDVTLQHLIPLLELLDSSGTRSGFKGTKYETLYAKEFTCHDLKAAVRAMEYDNSFRYILADAQWVLVLRLLTENSADDDRISWAEIVMCYRTCVLGMQTLQQIPEKRSIRSRIRQRSLSMLSTFKSSSIKQASTICKEKGQKGNESISIIVALLSATMIAILALWTVDKSPSPIQISRSNHFLKNASVIPGPMVPPFQLESEEPQIDQMTADGFNLAEPLESFTGLNSIASRSTEKQEIRASNRMRVPTPTANLHARRLSSIAFSEPLLQQEGLSPEDSDIADIPLNMKTVEIIAGGVFAVGVLGPLGASLGSYAVAALPPLASIGATVVFSTLLAHGIRDWFSVISSKFRKRR